MKCINNIRIGFWEGNPKISGSSSFLTHLDENLEGEDEGADGGEEAEPEGGAGGNAALVHAGEDPEKQSQT